ncbi:MAG: DUF3843 family protein [bacterium]|nr:DUF3843 family protein [bacterium]
MKERIYIKQWLALKPYDKHAPSDVFYLKISNEVKQSILRSRHLHVLQMHLDKVEIDIFSCFIASYLEDLVSDTNIWNAYIKCHKELYQKPLPFFDVDAYFEEEINIQDICFLIWYFLNAVQQDKFILSHNNFVYELANDIYDVLDNAWENAPENHVLKTFFTIDDNETDFYVIRNFIDTILFETYLFYPDTLLKLHIAEEEIIKKTDDIKNHHPFLSENRDNTLHTIHTQLLSLTGKEWASKILTEKHSLYHDFINISTKIIGYFLYKGQDNQDVFIEYVATGKKFKLTKKSFDYSYDLKEIDDILFIGIVRWKNEWWFSGYYIQLDFNANLVLDERNSIKSRMQVDFLDMDNESVFDSLKKQLDVFLEFNNGHQIAFIDSDSVQEFVNGFTSFFNKSLQLTAEEGGQTKQRAQNEGFFVGGNNLNDISKNTKSTNIFFNPKSGLEFAFGINSAFPFPNNPFFVKEESESHIKILLMNESYSTELVMYCLNNCSMDLPFFKEEMGKWILKDLDFLLRFWKKDFYVSKPSGSLTGGVFPL